MKDRPGFWQRLKAVKPSFVTSKPHFNFITAHYILILTCTIVGSVLVFAIGKSNLNYIDALFFAAGSSTQAGLNPVDFDLLNTGQQVILFLIPFLANPITVNSMVVYLRLYWFEKHFHQLVKEARLRRTTISKTRSKDRGADPEYQATRSQAAHDLNNGPAASSGGGVRGRRITVMHSSARAQRMAHDGAMLSPVPDMHSPLPSSMVAAMSKSSSSDSSQMSTTDVDTTKDSRNGTPDNGNDSDGVDPLDSATARSGGHIAFVSTVKRSDGLDAQTNFQPGSHGPFLTPQSATTTNSLTGTPVGSQQQLLRPALSRAISVDGDEVLRIPNPREVEQGIVPTRVSRNSSAGPRPESRDESQLPQVSVTNPGQRTTIMIAEPGPEARIRNVREEMAEEAEIVKNTLSIFSMPRWLKRLLGRDDESSTIQFRSIRSFMSGNQTTQEMPYLSYTPTTGRNSQFIGLTLEQREELGGIEYRSLRTLAVILGAYFWGFYVFGMCFLLPFIMHNAKYGHILEENQINKPWWGVFTTGSAFMDLGFTLTANSMYSFNSSTLVMLIMSFLIVIGNTGFPVMLRFMIWLTSLFVPKGSGLWEELRFLLDHPRRCFTLLFPSSATWWLFGVLILLNGVDVILFIILDLNAPIVTDMPVHTRILDALFQAVSTRTAGFACLDISQLHPGVQVSYMIMMYISVFPIAISIRRTNVYEERSLGMYESRADDHVTEDNDMSYVGMHLRRQLSFDLWYVFLGLFILAISEGKKVQRNEFTMWAVLFEVISAYGTVGMSLGYPGVNTSLSGQFSVVGKLVTIAMQIRGRHRGLPYGLDRAILLPSQQRFERETQLPPDTVPPLQRTLSTMSRRGTLGIAKSRTSERDPGLFSRLLHPGPALPHEFRKLSHGHLHMPRTMSTGTPHHTRRVNSLPITDDESEDMDPGSTMRRRANAGTRPMERALTTS